MGGPKWYNQEPGYTDNRYIPIGEKINVNGIIGEILALKEDPDGTHSSMPSYSGESDIYFRQRQNRDDKKIVVVQGSLYIGHKKVCDFDWGHEHKNRDGTVFQEGVVHVQFYESDSEGNQVRAFGGDARYMNNAEIKRYGPIIRYICPGVKFRPSRKKK